ncbi:MAG: hypothetical protein QOH90_2139 [Actinomycetota bacterium]|nr:hypothetical protein [Actinomycetota bacterium]
MIALVSAGALVVPAAAAASTVSVEGGVLRVVAAPGEANQVSVTEHVPPGSSTPSEYGVKDTGAGTTPGPGCGPDPLLPPEGSPVVCSAAGVQSFVIHLGDGDDGVDYLFPGLPASVYGEGGSDRIAMFRTAGSFSDGGEGDDDLQGGDDVRGGPGNDQILGYRLLDGGDGNDVLVKSNAKGSGRLTGGPGDDSLQSDDGYPDQLQCGDGRDVIANADGTDKNDGTCESGKGVGGARPPVKAQITVFELPKGRSRPGPDGRLAVWMRCSVANCSATVRIFAAGEVNTDSFARFRIAPLRHVVVGKKAKLVHLRLTRQQRRALRRTEAYSGVGAIVITRRPGADAKMLTDGLYCQRADPCLVR